MQGKRRRGMSGSIGPALPIPLPEAPEGSVVKVVGVTGGRGLVRRLYELGMLPGTRMKVLRSLRPGPVIVSLPTSGTISLGYGVAMKILVEVVK